MMTSVRKACRIIPLLIGLSVLTAPLAQAQIGFAAGYSANVANSPSFSGSQNSFEPAGGVNFGMFYDFRFGNFTIRPGVFIRQADFDWELDGINPNLNPLQSSVRVAEFPIDLIYRIQTQSLSPYLVVGPSFNFLHTDQPDLRQILDNPTGSTNYASFTVGAGLEIQPQGWGVILLPEIRYGMALSGFTEESYIVRTVSYSADSAQKLSSLVVRLGITLPNY